MIYFDNAATSYPKPVSVKAQMLKVHADEFGTAQSSGALKGNVDTSGFNPEDMNVESFASGNVSFENAKIMSEAGADIFVAGTSSVFKTNNLNENISILREIISAI